MGKVALKRTCLYSGGTSPSKLLQARFFNEDCLVYDLEDSVPPAEKDAARHLIYNLITFQRPRGKYVIIRVNGIYSEYIDEDLEMAVRARPDAIRIPKVEYGCEVKKIAERITEIEKKAGIEVCSTEIWCNIESYFGVLNAREIAEADLRVVALALGAEDFTASMKATRTKHGLEIFYARNAILLACRAAGVDAVDAVFSDINDTEALKEDAELSKNLGFDGKTVIHPRQIDIVNAAFTPGPKEIKYALQVLEAIEEGKKAHTGAVTLDGSMIDKPMELRALTTLAQARAAGIKV